MWLRINVNKELCVFSGTSSDGEDLDSSSQHQPQKRKNQEWAEVGYTGTLGVKPQEFVTRLGTYCQTLDVHQEIQDTVSITPEHTTTTLLSLATAHALHMHGNNMARFLQAIIEIQIALQCERFVYCH